MATNPKMKKAAPAPSSRVVRDEVLHRVNTVLPLPVYQWLAAEARKQRRTLAQQFAVSLEHYISERGAA